MKYVILLLFFSGFFISQSFATSYTNEILADIDSSQGIFGPPVIEIPKLLSPLKQFESGIRVDEISCKENLQLVIKASDGSPACIKPETKTKLIERGWAKQ